MLYSRSSSIPRNEPHVDKHATERLYYQVAFETLAVLTEGTKFHLNYLRARMSLSFKKWSFSVDVHTCANVEVRSSGLIEVKRALCSSACVFPHSRVASGKVLLTEW